MTRKHGDTETRRWIVLASMLVALVVLAGCAGAAKPAATPVAVEVPTRPPCATAAPAQAKQEGTYYFLAANNSDPFYVPGVKGFQDAAAKVGMKAEFVGPMDLNVAAQVKTLEELVANPATKGIFIYAIDYNALRPPTEEAKAKGIPVVNGAADSPYKARDAFIGYDNSILGVQAAETAMRLTGGKGKIGTIGVNGANVNQRRQAFLAHIKANYPDATAIEGPIHDGSAQDAEKQLDAYLAANPDLTLLWWADGVSGQMAQVWKEKQAAGVKTMFMATDMPDATLQAVKDKVFVASIGQDTYTEEYWGVLLLDALRNGKRVPDTLYLSAIIVTPENVDQYLK